MISQIPDLRGGGGYSGVKTENNQSAKKCLNLIFRGCGGCGVGEAGVGVGGG